jgi:Concanavalin A-like lectin/glucanases superfamily
MADTWELICHHTYRGIPGVVVDASPPRASYGKAIGLDDGDFLADGVTPGSGAVRFFGNGSVYVPANAPAWQSVIGIKGEVILRRIGQSLQENIDAFVIDSDSFKLHISQGDLVACFNSSPVQYTEIDARPVGVEPQTYAPIGQWVTVGFLHDGLGTVELSVNGQVVAQRSGTYAPVNPPGAAGLNIGNTRTLDRDFGGQIDDVKIWRLNPHRFDDNYFGRPVDAGTAECWKRFWQDVDAASRQNSQCARYVASSLLNLIRNLVRQALAKGPETRAHLLSAAQQYDQLWRKDDIGGSDMATVFANLITWLRLVGLLPNPELTALINSDCLKLLVAGIRPPDCDPEAVRMLQSIVNSLNTSGGGPIA